jgi:hypothetical protein
MRGLPGKEHGGIPVPRERRGDFRSSSARELIAAWESSAPYLGSPERSSMMSNLLTKKAEPVLHSNHPS